ncbi:MAG: DUF58 domain-containing protein [Gemmatimonadales bacterium]|nr:MAG: DUF58 domain-containing protein [Gemmatimonadales bacterium]
MTPSRGGPGEDEHLRTDPRLPGYLIAGFGALLAAIATGMPELAALGAPVLALAAVGIAARDPARLRGEVRVHNLRVLEGDVVEGELSVDWDGVAEVEVMLTGFRGVTPLDPTPEVGWSVPRTRGPLVLPFRFRATAWGTHDLGTLWVQARRPGSLLVWERKLAAAPRLQVLPRPLRLDRLLRPAEPRAVAGMHVSRLRGRGTDFAELRPYQPGDRLRDLSWGTSARLGSPWVIVHHPERTGTVLLLLDAFFTRAETGTEALARAARAAWAVAAVHLRAQDRVGILTHGVTTAWLPPQGGRRARWMLLNELLTVGGAVEDQLRRRRASLRVAVPSDALVVGITNLRSPSFTKSLLHHRRTGRTTVALVVDTLDLLPEPAGPVDEAARRIWLGRREADRHLLDRGGIPTALVTSTDGVGPAISALRRRTGRAGAARMGARR